MQEAREQAQPEHGFIFEMTHKLTGECRYVQTVPKGTTIKEGLTIKDFELRLVTSKVEATRFPTAEIAAEATGSLSLIATENLDFSVLEV
jgi:hypothetical protein